WGRCCGGRWRGDERVTLPAPVLRTGQRGRPLRQSRKGAMLTRGRFDPRRSTTWITSPVQAVLTLHVASAE
ncbi:hypothetical protein ACL02U_25200, partial [Streptomyces sp. MS06]|uniref:hypothetical protein n=1 Tax=Streptomyces sp. MS06 TaxID=3385974 RepID=UPI00399FAC03